MSVFTLGNYTVHLGTDLLGFQLPEGLKILSSRTLQTYLFILYNSDTDSCDIILILHDSTPSNFRRNSVS